MYKKKRKTVSLNNFICEQNDTFNCNNYYYNTRLLFMKNKFILMKYLKTNTNINKI